eukprot:5541531-Ditylum_brightwellii.AAC.1
MMNLIVTGVTISMDCSVAEAPLSFMRSPGVMVDILGLSSDGVVSYRVATAHMDFLKCLGALAELLLNSEALILRFQASVPPGDSTGIFLPGNSTRDVFPMWTFPSGSSWVVWS